MHCRAWFSSMFMSYDEVCNIICSASLNKLTHNVISTVETLAVGKYKPQFLGKLFETGAWRM